MSNTTELIAEREARLHYAEVHDRFATLEQQFTGAGETGLAQDAHDQARISLTAYRAEMDDPDVHSEVLGVQLAAALFEVSAILRRHRR